jgi:hypothetical protein
LDCSGEVPTMLTYQQAQQLQQTIQQESPQVEVEIAPEIGQPGYYYLVVHLDRQPRFVVRSLEQWRTRKHTLK